MKKYLPLFNNLVHYFNFAYFPIILFVIGIEFIYINENIKYSHLLEIQLFILYILILAYNITKNGLFHIFSILIGTIGLFSFMGLFFSIFSDIDYRKALTVIEIDLPEIIVQKTILLYSLFIVVLNYSFIYFSKRDNLKNKSCLILPPNLFLLNIGKSIMLLCLGFALYRGYLEVKLLFGNRNLLFIGGSDSIGLPLYLRLASSFFQAGYLFILASLPPKKIFIKYTLIYILTIIPGMIIGNRMLLALSVLFIVWYLYKFYNHKFNYLKIFLCGVSFMFILQVIALTRTNSEISEISLVSLLQLFFISQSTSFYVLPLYIQYKTSIIDYNYPFILDPIIGGFTGATGQSYETLEVRSSLGHQLIYSLNPEYYLNGYSLGTTSIAELYEFGIVGILLGAILFAWMVYHFNYMVDKHRGYLLFSMIIFFALISSPRANFFPSLYDICKNLIFYLVILTLYKAIKLNSYKVRIFKKITNKIK